jgi:hypothetical protein
MKHLIFWAAWFFMTSVALALAQVAPTDTGGHVWIGPIASSQIFTLLPGAAISSIGTAPSIVASSCGTGSPAVTTGSTDVRGSFTEGTLGAGCQLTLANPYPSVPFVVASSKGGTAFAVAVSAAISGTTVTITFVNASLTGAQVTYQCFW